MNGCRRRQEGCTPPRTRVVPEMCVDEETAGAGIRRIVDSWQPADLDFSIQNGVKSNLDSRVATALSRLGSPVEETIDGYLNCFCPLFSVLRDCCCLWRVRDGRIAEAGQCSVQLRLRPLFSGGLRIGLPDNAHLRHYQTLPELGCAEMESSRVHSTTPPAAASGMGSGSRWENNNRAECPFYAALDQVVEARPVLDASLNWGSDLHHSCAITSN